MGELVLVEGRVVGGGGDCIAAIACVSMGGGEGEGVVGGEARCFPFLVFGAQREQFRVRGRRGRVWFGSPLFFKNTHYSYARP